MRHGTTATAKIPAAPLVGQPIDPEVVEFREAFEARSTLDEIIREGARKMLQAAIESGSRRLRGPARRSTRRGPASDWSSAMVIFPPGNFSQERVLCR